MHIPLKIVKAGLTEDYVQSIQLMDEIRKKQRELYKRGTEINDSMRKLWIYTAGRNYSFIHPTEMRWTTSLAIYELTKEMMEVSAEYKDLERDLAECQQICRQLNLIAEKKEKK